MPAQNTLITSDVLVYGATLGGAAAAITAAQNGASVTLVSDSPFVGGQAVESGVSAFDDADRNWETFGLYAELQQYLQEKYPFQSKGHFGLGEAAVGRVATLPSDIEEFFLQKLEKQGVRLLKNYSLQHLKHDEGIYTEASFRNKAKKNESATVRFAYLLDGTQEGAVFGKIGSGFTIGFDVAEETHEESALPRSVREKILEGYTVNNVTLVRGGNRVQAVSSPFALMDKGYSGDFYPVNNYDAECWTPVTIPSVIGTERVMRASKKDCAASIDIDAEFSDVYDVLFINHGNASARYSIVADRQIPPLEGNISLDENTTFGKIGSFFIDNRFRTTVTLTAPEPGFQAEGIILRKRNLRQSPVITHGPFQNTVPIVHQGRAFLSADAYFVTSTDLPRQSFPFTINGKEFEARKIGRTTYRAESIPLRNENTLSVDPQVAPQIASAIMIPTALDDPALHRLTDSTGEERDPSSFSGSTLWARAYGIKEWAFSPEQEGDHVFLLQWPDPSWATLELFNVTDHQSVLSLTFGHKNYVRHDFHPLFVMPLSKGKEYRIRIGLMEDKVWTPFTLALSPLALTNNIYKKAAPPLIPHGDIKFSGIYDVWVKAIRNNSKPELEVANARTRKFISIPNASTFAYAGKYYIHKADQMGAYPAGVSQEILLIPNTHVNTYVHYANQTETLRLSDLPAGMLHVLMEKKVTVNADSMVVKDAQDGAEQRLPLVDINATYTTTAPFHSAGAPLEFRLSPATFPKDATLVFYEQIPDDAFLRWFFGTTLPLFYGESPTTTSQFSFRNIVSGKSLLTKAFPNLPSAKIARNSLGITLMMDPTNDYAPVGIDDLSSQEITDQSRLLSYAYYYWLKYDMAQTQQNLGCSAEDPMCDTQRIQLAIGIFPNPKSIFPPKPYIREARRLSAVTTITERDITLDHSACHDPVSCSSTGCIAVWRNNFCTQTTQEPVVFPDAIGATHYSIDIHSFYSRPEQDLLQRWFTAMKNDKVIAQSPLLFSQSRYHWSKPSEVRLGAVIPRSIPNVLPASSTIGTTQIAHGAYRTHVNELVIGQAVGHVVAYCLRNNLAPRQILENQNTLKTFQNYLIESGMHIYPLDSINDPAAYAEAQRRIVEGSLKPSTHVARNHTVKYTVNLE